MGEWLIGVYKGRLITASDNEKKDIWKNLLQVHTSGLFDTTTERAQFRPYFFMLLPAPEDETVIVRRNKYIPYDGKVFLKRYGLGSAAYRYGTIQIPAYGSIEKGSFVLDERYAKKEYFRQIEECWPDPEERVCALALMRDGWRVRTGTFFKFDVKRGKIMFESCTSGGNYLMGKGILLDLDAEARLGSMREDEAKAEMQSPVSKLCARFTYEQQYGKHKFYITYREVPTDLRADMPLAMLKLCSIANALEQMFQNLGAQCKQLVAEKRLRLAGRNVLLDGTIVDYADLKDTIDFDNPEDQYLVASAKNELRSLLFAAALLSATREDGLAALTKGKAELVKLTNKRFDKIYERYAIFFDHFALGAGGAIKYFRDIQGEAGLLNFFGPDFP